MAVAAPDKTMADVRLGAGFILVVTGLFVGGMGAIALVDEWNWRGAVIAPCVITGKGEAPIVTCEIRTEGQPPILFSYRYRAHWRDRAIGDRTEIEYLPSDPTRFRQLDPPASRGGRVHSYRIRGGVRWAVGGILLAVGVVSLFYGLRFIKRRPSRAEP
jgi:hypothetical protein